MDVTEYAESDYVTKEIVEKSPSKKAVIMMIEDDKTSQHGKKLHVTVEIDGKKKIYSPNKPSINNILDAYGPESTDWIGRVIGFTVENVNGFFCVIARPESTLLPLLGMWKK